MSVSHHADAAQMENMKRFTEQMERTEKRAYPKGRMGHEDDGELSYAVIADKKHGTVIIRFGKPVEWIGLSPSDVTTLIESLIEKARQVSTEPFEVRI